MEVTEEGERQKSEMLVKGFPYQPVGSEHRVVVISLHILLCPFTSGSSEAQTGAACPRLHSVGKEQGSPCSSTMGLHIQSPQSLTISGDVKIWRVLQGVENGQI